MARAFGYVVVMFAAAIGLLWPLIPASGSDDASSVDDPVTITTYAADYGVDAGGRLTATETITAEFPSGRHGIFRFWDVTTASDPHVRHIPDIVSVEQDGGPASFERSTSQGARFVVAKIGDPDVYVAPGLHVYRITYTIDGVLDPADEGAESVFHWSVVAPGWQMPIDRADVTVHLPAPSAAVECHVTGSVCTVAGEGAETVTIGATGLAPRTGVDARIGLGTEAPARDTVPWSVSWDQILGRSVPTVAAIGMLSLLAFAAASRWAWTSREPEPGLPVLYSPPEGLGPVQSAYVCSETPGSAPLAATLLYAAEQGLVELTPAGPGAKRKTTAWEVRGTADRNRWAAADPVTRALGDALGVSEPGTVLRADGTKAAGEQLSKATRKVPADCRTWARRSGLLVPSTAERLGKAAVALALVLAVVGFVGTAWPSMWGLPGAAFVLGGWGLLRPGVGTRRTPAGREMWSRAGGFRRMLVTPSSEDRYRFSAEQNLYTRYIPYAVAFGVADKWAAKYRMAMDAEPPAADWYPTPVGARGFASGARGVDSFESALSASISAYTASQSSSGSSSSGGGGGGGGGGSW
ncbi:MAG: DUF2207 domain-containing protein [Nocardiaceae bacterium]|nr:DUF2207 domain-containing protein [Nocardiaceae bacterium]